MCTSGGYWRENPPSSLNHPPNDCGKLLLGISGGPVAPLKPVRLGRGDGDGGCLEVGRGLGPSDDISGAKEGDAWESNSRLVAVVWALVLGCGMGFFEVSCELVSLVTRGILGLGMGLGELSCTVPGAGWCSLSCLLGGTARGLAGIGRFM